MSDSSNISRRAFASGLALVGLGASRARAQGFAGLGRDAAGFATVVPGRALTFPADHGPHPGYRIEWWYLTANLMDANGVAFGAQWTLFRQAMSPGQQQEGWANQHIWMGHTAITRADTHRSAEAFARGGVGQAGVTASPFLAWIDAWQMRGLDAMSDASIAPLEVAASGADFSYALRLDAQHPLVLQGDAGYSKKSDRGQSSYYYSQPFFNATGSVTIDGKAVAVNGQAWMDREWSSQPLASDQTGWDWFSLHLSPTEKLMLFRLRQRDGQYYFSGNWIADGRSVRIASSEIGMTPLASTRVEGRDIPTAWRVDISTRDLQIETTPLNPLSWMTTSFPYWEGPIRFKGTHGGVGYLEMTGY